MKDIDVKSVDVKIEISKRNVILTARCGAVSEYELIFDTLNATTVAYGIIAAVNEIKEKK